MIISNKVIDLPVNLKFKSENMKLSYYIDEETKKVTERSRVTFTRKV